MKPANNYQASVFFGNQVDNYHSNRMYNYHENQEAAQQPQGREMGPVSGVEDRRQNIWRSIQSL